MYKIWARILQVLRMRCFWTQSAYIILGHTLVENSFHCQLTKKWLFCLFWKSEVPLKFDRDRIKVSWTPGTFPAHPWSQSVMNAHHNCKRIAILSIWPHHYTLFLSIPFLNSLHVSCCSSLVTLFLSSSLLFYTFVSKEIVFGQKYPFLGPQSIGFFLRCTPSENCPSFGANPISIGWSHLL